MGLCSDPAITYLKRLGYNVVRLPREGIQPLHLLGQQRGTVEYLGSLEKLITQPPSEPPAITRDQAAAGINGQKTENLSFSIGINILKSVLAQFGAGAGIEAQYNQARKVRFEFSNVLADSVEPLAVGQFLKMAEVDADNPVLKQYVLGNGRLYVITQVIKSNEFTVAAEKSGGGSIQLDVPEIQKVVGGKLKVEASVSSQSTVTYKGEKQLVFGFKCFEIGVKNGEITLFASQPGAIAMALDAAGGVMPSDSALLDEGGLLDLEGF
ncbi:hypothetical protein [Vitiosangium sp. GDMCC 1.1324]|uniref:Gasdermin bGSDM n=1 Tax=Vitiosangium sp. (strain GDMCC 1.1324) TaxID=2138576 RepID=GSDM_VITXG|nr:hypothetical protein [Vitiosangium sp. GDMCC 1.1324]A0A2T4VDM4.1 RecName: Full=Gasdermin bGSDM; Short=bGSDM; AltName: Full=Bacterial gasdermin; Contains: RecName: Full=Gasdermin bGSDM, N-terminus [Vitiosangium sp. GDMCC 1.1324]PTL79885.1 hypothetical protein DAT35_31115 [Vitiosangium sp. GDMCC 1.1324]